MQTPAERPGEPGAGPAKLSTIEVLYFTSPRPDIPDLEVVIDRHGMGSLRVRWCEKKLSRPVLEALLAEGKETGQTPDSSDRNLTDAS
jgi:hypothetical protein